MSLKKQKRKIFFSKISLIALLGTLVFGTAVAQPTVEDMQGTVTDKQQQLDQLKNEIADLQVQINKKTKEAASLKNEVALFDLQIRQTETQIAAVQVEIDRLTLVITGIREDIQKKENEIVKQKDVLAETLRLINEYDNVTPLEMTLNNDTFSQFLDEVQYTANLQEKGQQILNGIKALKLTLEKQKADLEVQLGQQQASQRELAVAKNSLQRQRADKQTILNQTKGQEKIYQKLLGQAAQKQEQVEREIFDLEVAIRQQLGDKHLPAIAGLLQWPMSGILTQGYGKTGFTALGYSFHNGIDIAAPAGTKIYAAGDGLVYASGHGDAAYGNWVVIKHTLSKNNVVTNIYTLYGHMQSFVAETGKPIRGGDLVGYEGNTGNTTRLLYGPDRGYHLHFSVFDEEDFGIKDGAYQKTYGSYQIPYGYTYNPLEFLRS